MPPSAICGTYDGEVGRLAAIRGASPEYRAELMRAGPQKPEPGGSLIPLVEGEPLVHIADITHRAARPATQSLGRSRHSLAGSGTKGSIPVGRAADRPFHIEDFAMPDGARTWDRYDAA